MIIQEDFRKVKKYFGKGDKMLVQNDNKITIKCEKYIKNKQKICDFCLSL